MDYGLKTDENLVVMAQNGDQMAEEMLINRYRETVKGRAHLYFIMGADNEDVVQEGMIGIFKAIKNYQPDKGTSFKTFAGICINRQIITAIKAAARLKHSPLNTSLSINTPLSGDSIENETTLADILIDKDDSDPEAMFILKEDMNYIEYRGEEIFSPMELNVWNEYLKGKNYVQIAEAMDKNPKAIDNAVQRMKKKLQKYLETNR